MCGFARVSHTVSILVLTTSSARVCAQTNSRRKQTVLLCTTPRVESTQERNPLFAVMYTLRCPFRGCFDYNCVFRSQVA